MDDLMTAVGEQAPHCMLFADNAAQKGETIADLKNHLEHFQQARESNGLRSSREKTEYTSFRLGGGDRVWGSPPQCSASKASRGN